ncbi:MAG: DUF1186 domain-containing protein, partial [Bradyrhizobium sp.]
PVLALGLCTIRIEESAPALRALLERAADGETLSDDEELLLFRGLYILGGARDTEACGPLLRLLRRPGHELDDLLGEAVTHGLARIAAGLFDGDTEALFDLIVDSSVDEFVRDALLGAATFLTWQGLIARERMQRLLIQFYQQRLAPDDDEAWAGWLRAIAMLGLRDLAPLVHSAWDEGRIPPFSFDHDEFEQDLADAEQMPDDIERFNDLNLGYIEDVLEALEWTDYADDIEEDVFDEEFPFGDDLFADDDWTPIEPVRNPLRHVGRNDPCPCGSGKKAKKCCLARQD